MAIFIGKHLYWSLFLIKLQASRLANLLNRDCNTDVFLSILQTSITPISKNNCEQLLLLIVIYCIENRIKLFRNQTDLLFLLKYKITLFYLLSFVFIWFITRCHLLSLIVNFYYLLLFVVPRCHSLYFVVTCYTTRCHSLSLLVICFTTGCHSLYQSLSFVATRCHSLSLDVPLICLFINNRKLWITCYSTSINKSSFLKSLFRLRNCLEVAIKNVEWHWFLHKI